MDAAKRAESAFADRSRVHFDSCVLRLEIFLPRFDAIDADGSGTLQVAELVQGLLKVRGEVPLPRQSAIF